MCSGVVGECIDLVVAPGVERDPCISERLGMWLQLNELSATRWSPHGRAIHNKRCWSSISVFVKVQDFPGVVPSDNVGEPLANIGSSREISRTILSGSKPRLGWT